MAELLEPPSRQQREQELQTNLRFIARALRRIETGEDLETELRNLRTFILDCLTLVGSDQRVVHAADELYRLAHECAYEQEQDIILDEEPHVSPTHLEAAEAALARFQIALFEAAPAVPCNDLHPFRRACRTRSRPLAPTPPERRPQRRGRRSRGTAPEALRRYQPCGFRGL